MPILVDSGTPTGFRGFPGDSPGKLLSTRVATLGGLTLGAVDDNGVRLYLSGVEGWWSGTGSTGDVTQRAGGHGGWSNLPFRTARRIELTVEPWGLDFDHVTPAIDAVIAAIPLRNDTLMIASGDETLQATVQQDGEPLVDRSGRPGSAKITIPLIAPDFRRYSVDTVTASTGLPQTTGGLSLNGTGLSLPLSVGASLTSGVLSVTNDGNTDTPPTLTVDGPCPPFSIAHRKSGAVLRFADAISAGRSLVIDTANHRALMDGTATRTVTGTWFTYSPGVNEVGFSADSYDAGALLTSTHRNAWK